MSENRSLAEVLNTLLKISGGDVDTLSDTTEAFERQITGNALIPPEPVQDDVPVSPNT